MPVYHPSNTVIYGRISGNRLRLLRTGDRPSLAILRTNKQVHAEASSILYGDNSVDLSGEEYPFFLSRGSCSRQYAGLIRRLALGYPQCCPALVIADLCPGLTEITFRAPDLWSYIGTPERIDETIEALARFDRHLRAAFPRLERICIEVWRRTWPIRPKYRGPAIKMKDALRQAGWVMVEKRNM
ncbi:hypothetical protein PG991_003891 [Apiospora marii]|uniref:Uncharacterized protein n=1 Tax=Apiospora marii TaxID=335849 RepID=A0ABR1S612_9PEZI